MLIRVYLITIDEHWTVFDDLDAAMGFIRGYISRRAVGSGDPVVTMESQEMEQDRYVELANQEDGV